MGTRRVSSPHGEFTLFFTYKSPFSNFFQCNFKAKALDKKSIDCTCVEQFYMYNKAVSCGDFEVAKQILAKDDPKEIKRLGSKLVGFDRAKWDEISEDVMKTALKAKFSRNEDLREMLFATHGSELVECSPMDRTWGIGLAIDAPEARNPKLWNGKNKLGKLMTKVREKLWSKSKFKEDRQNAEKLATPEAAIKYFETHCRYSPEPSIARPAFIPISGSRIIVDKRTSRRRLRSRSPTPPSKHPRISFHSEPSNRYRKDSSPRRRTREETPDAPSKQGVSSSIVKVEKTDGKQGSAQSHHRSSSPLKSSRHSSHHSRSSETRSRSRRDSAPDEADHKKTEEAVKEKDPEAEKKKETPAKVPEKSETPLKCPVNKSSRRPSSSQDVSPTEKKEADESTNQTEQKEEKPKREPIKWTEDKLPRSFRSRENLSSSGEDNRSSRKRTKSPSSSPKRRRRSRSRSPVRRRRYRSPLRKRRRGFNRVLSYK